MLHRMLPDAWTESASDLGALKVPAGSSPAVRSARCNKTASSSMNNGVRSCAVRAHDARPDTVVLTPLFRIRDFDSFLVESGYNPDA